MPLKKCPKCSTKHFFRKNWCITFTIKKVAQKPRNIQGIYKNVLGKLIANKQKMAQSGHFEEERRTNYEYEQLPYVLKFIRDTFSDIFDGSSASL
jgi:hypothetical protein